jgi:hypothetical protein
MEVEIQGSSPSNSIDHTGRDSLESDSDEEEYVTGISYINEISYTDGISHGNGIPHDNGIPHADGMSHADMTSHPHVMPPRIKHVNVNHPI